MRPAHQSVWLRILPIAALAIVLISCIGGVWAARSSDTARFVLPGATDLLVEQRGVAGLHIEYRAATADYGWREQIRQRLIADGWRAREYTFGTTRQFEVTWYTRRVSFGPLEVMESAVVGGDPRDTSRVSIEFHRRPSLHWPWAGSR